MSKMDTLIYAAYGSNLHLLQMRNRCPDSICMGKGILEDYKLVFGLGGYLDVVPEKGCSVNVGLFQVSKSDLDALDLYEEYPMLYNRFLVEISIGTKRVQAILYRMNAYIEGQAPSKEYWDVVNEGFENFSFDKYPLNQALDKVCKIENENDFIL